jgi:TPP-dependent pyruvate/acetoin dehydrogenase alpha subunit
MKPFHGTGPEGLNMNVGAALLRDMYRAMLLARRFDLAQIAFYKTGKEPMESVHSYIGQEAIGVGAGFAMEKGDVLLPSLRSRPAFFALGVPLEMQWAGVLGRADSPGKGLIGSRHMTAMEYGIAGTTGILGAQIPVATGVSLAQQAANQGRATVCLFGDGAANRGDCHEGMNMAAIYKAPVVFICEANGVAETQHWDSYMPIDDLSIRAAGYGMPGHRIDGNDVQSVYQVTRQALERARTGLGPSFIVAETCRMHPHVEGLPDFREAELMTQWKARDPLEKAERQLLEAGVLTKDQLQELYAAADREIESGRDAALAKSLLDAAEMQELVYHTDKEA